MSEGGFRKHLGWITSERTGRMNYTYILGGNLELNVEYRVTKDEPDVNYFSEVIIEAVYLPDGSEFEIDDIRIGDYSLEALMKELANDA